jgi:hypothetical protein
MVGLADAQEKIPDSVIDDIARDLAVLQREVIKAGDKQRGEVGVSYGPPAAVTVNKPATTRMGADKNASVSFKIPAGTTLPVLDKTQDWYAVQNKSKQVGWVSASDVTPVPSAHQTPPNQGGDEGLFRTLTEKASQMRDKYKNNPYVFVKGFTVNLSLVPSVSVDFEFK